MQTNKKSISLTLASFAVAGVFAYSVPMTFAEFTSQTTSSSNSAEAGSLSVELVDANGNVTTTPVISITNAQPGMADQVSTIRIANTGTLASDIRLYTKNLQSSSNNLDDVLTITLKDQASNNLYSGSISNLDVNFSNVAPGATMPLTAILNWPDLVSVDDNPYQAATLNFEFAIDSASVAV